MMAVVYRAMLATLPLLLAGASCLPIGDSAARLSGRIVVNGEPAASDCELSLFLASTNQRVESIKVRADFEETFVIAPGEDDYYATISCEGVAGQYRSPALRLGSLSTYRDGTDLGTVSLSRTATK